VDQEPWSWLSGKDISPWRLKLRQDYEVVIIGAGPAGAILAYELAGKRIRVLSTAVC